MVVVGNQMIVADINNYTLRAIPLAAGKHHLLVEYAPPAYTFGKWCSILAGCARAIA